MTRQKVLLRATYLLRWLIWYLLRALHRLRLLQILRQAAGTGSADSFVAAPAMNQRAYRVAFGGEFYYYRELSVTRNILFNSERHFPLSTNDFLSNRKN